MSMPLGFDLIDVHCHILPGLDDGPSSMGESLEMVRMAAQDGIAKIVCTPHYIPGLYRPQQQSIKAACQELTRQILKHEIPMDIFPGAEIHIDAVSTEDFAPDGLTTINVTGSYALIELPYQIMPRHIEDVFWKLISQDITPILAHVERYPYLIHDPLPLNDWLHMGVGLQVTASSLFGLFGPEVMDFSRLLLDHQMVSILSTDGHGSSSRRPLMSAVGWWVQEHYGQRTAQDVLNRRGECILRGEAVDMPDFIPFQVKKTWTRKILDRLAGKHR
ncbi:MAG: hypothetical protein K9K64_12350 [Desulfohalobiaceae bacterium]|nr:hypothetical protein [Desulfohalobiaceae bacterium]